MSSIEKDFQAAEIARQYDESFNYDLDPRERIVLGAMLVTIVIGIGCLVWGFAKAYEISRHTEAIEAETARIEAESNATCRTIRNQAILWKVYKCGRDGDLPIRGPIVTKDGK